MRSVRWIGWTDWHSVNRWRASQAYGLRCISLLQSSAIVVWRACDTSQCTPYKNTAGYTARSPWKAQFRKSAKTPHELTYCCIRTMKLGGTNLINVCICSVSAVTSAISHWWHLQESNHMTRTRAQRLRSTFVAAYCTVLWHGCILFLNLSIDTAARGVVWWQTIDNWHADHLRMSTLWLDTGKRAIVTDCRLCHI